MDLEAWQLAQIEAALSEADAGDFMPEKEMVAKFNQLMEPWFLPRWMMWARLNKEQKKAKTEADCKALQEEVDRKNQELKGKGKEEWNAYVKSLDGRKPKYCRLKNAGMVL